MRQAKVTGRGRFSPIAGAICVLTTVVMVGGCGINNDFLGMEDYQRDILLWLAAAQQPDGGVDCWDLNGDGVRDADEDVNGDGEVDVFDCRGVNCWDLNGNGIRDDDEDINGDGEVDVNDCRFPPS